MKSDRLASVFEAEAQKLQQKDNNLRGEARRAAELCGVLSTPADWARVDGGYRLNLEEDLWLFYVDGYGLVVARTLAGRHGPRTEQAEVSSVEGLAARLRRWGYGP